jgi:hypothetical protein
MWNFTTQSGLATTVLDFTNDLSLLGVGLVGLMAVAGGAIVFMALRYHLSQRTTPAVETIYPSQREAA